MKKQISLEGPNFPSTDVEVHSTSITQNENYNTQPVS